MNKEPISVLDLKERRQLCDDLEDCVLQDKDLLATIIDEFVYHLSDNEVKEYEVLVGSILGEDD
tara:strand:- start:48 stop:239 length:192 start_codon:yes stop_codon:yes gene_type:complete